jgi:hypothetical protein
LHGAGKINTGLISFDQHSPVDETADAADAEIANFTGWEGLRIADWTPRSSSLLPFPLRPSCRLSPVTCPLSPVPWPVPASSRILTPDHCRRTTDNWQLTARPRWPGKAPRCRRWPSSKRGHLGN